MGFRVKGKARLLAAAAVFIAAIGVGVALENLQEDRFIIETIPPEGLEGGEAVALPADGEVPVSVDYSDAADASSAKVNINTAGIEELSQIPGIGEGTARRIIDYRTRNGGFGTIQEIKEVSGIGEKKFQSIKDLIDVK